jgi:hypothetical protein
MTSRTIAVAGGLLAGLLVALPMAGRRRRSPEPTVDPPVAVAPTPEAPGDGGRGFLYGRVTTTAGATHEGRLRCGEGEEASWGDTFNGDKRQNPWAAHLPSDRRPTARPTRIFGIEMPTRIFGMEMPREGRDELSRRFMARFGDIARVESQGRDVWVTLKSGTRFDLDRYAASDFDDGVRVWDVRAGVVDLDSGQIRTIDFLPTARLADAPERLHGTVHTGQGEFTGFLQWDREDGVGTDELRGRTPDGDLRARFDTVRSIARRSPDSSQVTLRDGSEIVLSGTRAAGRDNRGIYVDDRRYGRVLVSWDAFVRLDLTPADSGPAYDEYPPGRLLTGRVTTRDGRRLSGRLVYDLDESETTETLDAPFRGVDYMIPFALIESIAPPGHDERARVTLRGGEELVLEARGDLAAANAGLLVFVDGRPSPEYVPWKDVAWMDLDRPPAVYPPTPGASERK